MALSVLILFQKKINFRTSRSSSIVKVQGARRGPPVAISHWSCCAPRIISHWSCCAPRILCDRICNDNTGSGRRVSGWVVRGFREVVPWGGVGGSPLWASGTTLPMIVVLSMVNVKCPGHCSNVPSSLLRPPFHQLPDSPRLHDSLPFSLTLLPAFFSSYKFMPCRTAQNTVGQLPLTA